MEKLYQVYVLQNPARRFYIGLSEDVHLRLEQHNLGVSKWTRGRGPRTLAWTSPVTTLGEAKKLETLLKQQKGGDGFYRLTGLKKSRALSGS